MTKRTVLWICAMPLVVAGCAAMPPHRDPLLAAAPAGCERTYQDARWKVANSDNAAELTRIQEAITADLKTAGTKKSCWTSSWEHHDEYELFSVEFDDQGWLAGEAVGARAYAKQLATLHEDLESIAGKKGSALQPLSLIVYTHGWHHSAAPQDSNVIAFRRLLERASEVERALCANRRSATAAGSLNGGTKAMACENGAAAPPWAKRRRVVGIYVGWRGDSVLGPLIEDTSIWDRKLAAEQVALGSVQELFAYLHSFYLEHNCHLAPEEGRDPRNPMECSDVRMLTIGHSFGGLITYRALQPRLMLGVVERVYDPEKPQKYAYSFGDLTVLINPAFEATRFQSLAEAAANRSYEGAASPSGAQLPILIIATSNTDRATEYAFPAFRWLTTVFEKASGAERSANTKTVGWDQRYQTHKIAVTPEHDACNLTPGAALPVQLDAEEAWWKTQRNSGFGAFDDASLDFCDSLRLERLPGWALERPPFLPLWVIQADKSVIDGHNDFLNQHFLDFIRQVYYTILREEDTSMEAGIQEYCKKNPGC